MAQRYVLLAAHRAKVEANIGKWTEALQLIDVKIDFYGEWLEQGERHAVGPLQRLRRTRISPDAAPGSNQL